MLVSIMYFLQQMIKQISDYFFQLNSIINLSKELFGAKYNNSCLAFSTLRSLIRNYFVEYINHINY